MKPERWEEIQSVLNEALRASPRERHELLRSRCGADSELHDEVSSLLAASDQAEEFFDSLSDRVWEAVEEDDSWEWLAPGDLVAGFRVVERIGFGGMGEVYRATDERLRRDVALKVLSGGLVDDPGQVSRFEREARILAALSHPSIAAIYGLEEVDGRDVLVLELIEGPTLSERLQDGPLPVDEALGVAEQIAAALEAAHGAGIVHRDLKPSNVKFTTGGHVKVLDFGIAKALPSALGPRAVTLTADASQVVGTPPYMSPEQLAGADADPASDVWAFGVVFFEMLTGERPFQGDFPAQTIARILEHDPDWGLLRQAAPQPLAELVERCLRKDAGSRPGSVKEARETLEALRSGIATGASGAAAQVGRKRPAPTTHDTFMTGQGGALQQNIRFCAAADGVRIAYATVGKGPTLVKAANWLNHLEYDWESPVWRHLLHAFAKEYHLIRYDERGNGLSDREVEDISFPAFVQDLETVITAAAPERFALFGVSQGCSVSVAYAIANPQRVSHLILLGGYARGAAERGPDVRDEADALLTLMRHGWGKDNPAFRQIFTSRMIPGATRDQMDWFNELQRMTTSPETACRLRQAFDEINVLDLLPRVTVPTLVIHARGDAAVPFEEGRILAREIPGARFCALDSDNHLVLKDEPAWPRFMEEVRRFLAE